MYLAISASRILFAYLNKISSEDPQLLDKLRKFLSDTKDDWNYILPEDLEKQRKKKDFFLLDLRKSEDYAKGHIPGAKNIFWLDLLKDENLKKLPKDKKIIAICYVGHTASQALTILKLLGYDATALKFGMGTSPAKGVPVAGWLDYGYEITKQTTSKEANDLPRENKEVDKKKAVRKITDDADIFIQVPIIRQSTDYSCGAACLLSVMGYYGIDPYEKQVMAALKTTLAGVDPVDFPKAAKKFDLNAKVKEGMTQDEIKKNLDDDIPVILDIQAWGNKKDYSDVWNEGHFVVAVGYDKEGYYLMDPSQIGYTYITEPELDDRWHDVEIGTKRKFYNVGIIVTGKEPKFKYNSVKIIE